MAGSGHISSTYTLRITLLLFFTALSAAWPWPDSYQNRDGELLRPRAAGTSEKANETTTIASFFTDISAATTQYTSADVSATIQSGHSNSTSIHATKTISINPVLPAGGLEMITPAAIAGIQYFKVGEYVTFAWNYTSLSVTPTAIDVLASCATNNQMYTITTNMTVEETGAVTWDTGEYQATASVPLLVATYSLIIYDASKDISAIPSAGYLDTWNQYSFGMYTPQPYVPLSEFVCAACNGAISQHEKQAVGFILATGTITVLAFSWFAGAAGII